MSKETTAAANLSPAPQLGEQVLHVPLEKIHVDYSWNSRAERRIQDMADTESAGFEGFGAGIRQNGQLMPVILRNTKGKTITGAKTDKEYELLVGFRRTRAVTLLNTKGELDRAKAENRPTVIPNLPNGCISAIVRDIHNKTQARIMNGLENTGRTQLEPADQMFLAKELADDGLNQTAIGEALSISQGWVSRLLTIAKLPLPVLNNWRNGTPIPPVTTKDGTFEITKEMAKSQKELTQPDMWALAQLKSGPEEITARYIRMVTPEPKQGEGPGTGEEEKDKVIEEVRAIARLMACMVKAGVLENGTRAWATVIGPKKENYPIDCGKDRSHERMIELQEAAEEAYLAEIDKGARTKLKTA